MSQQDTEKQIREKLEATGQLNKMRAMIVDAALQTLNSSSSNGADGEKLFVPTRRLSEAKESEDGRRMLGVVADYLAFLGLDYTLNIFQLEAGLSRGDNGLPSGAALAAALHTEGSPSVLAGLLAARAGGSSSLPLPVPSPTAAAPGATAPVMPFIPVPGAIAVPKPVPAAAAAAQPAADAQQQQGGEDSTYYISKWNKRTFIRQGQVNGQQVQVEYLTDCTVAVLDPLDSMTVDDCEGGELIIAACEGSVFLRNCKNMTVHVACKQLRTRDCENVDLHIFTTTDPVVEMSHHMTFRPFHLRLPALKQSFKESRLDPKLNRFVHVYDFTADEKSLPKPHFTVLFPEHEVTMEDRYADKGTPECPPEIEDLVALRLLPASSSESGLNKSYDIKSGAAVWAATAAAPDKDESAEDVEEEEEVEDSEDKNSEESVVEEQQPAPAVVPKVEKPATETAAPAKDHKTTGGLDDEDYSSFDEDSEDSHDSNDKYNVDEDDDDF